jgi:hypothetical protein
MIRWFKDLSARRKVLLFLFPGMLTLVWDAFFAHWSFAKAAMPHWTQYIPVIYGVLAFVALAVATLLPMAEKASVRICQATGVVGLFVGAGGIYFHGMNLLESLEGETMSFATIGKAVKLAPPIFAPAAFAGIGLLIICLDRIAKPKQQGHQVQHHTHHKAAG